MNQEAYIAATRFGLGPRPEDEARMAGNPKQWLRGQLTQQPVSPYFRGLASSADNIRVMAAEKMASKGEKDRDNLKAAKKEYKEVFLKEMRARLQHAVATEAAFHERLVNFWSNHFTVSVKKGAVVGIVGAFEREVIRPRVTGKFIDMLAASSRHPTMLAYLDNAQSIGPRSSFGERKEKGLNENLAREILELHTLGVTGGYTQADVTSFAKIITGWTIGKGGKQGNVGSFVFDPQRHEPGAQVVMGKTYDQAGVDQGMAVLQDIAAHPATARFIADTPPPEAVDALAATFTQTGGDLAAVYRTLIDLPQAWQLSTPKIKSSYDLVVSAARLCGMKENAVDWCLQSIRFLGDVPFNANSPAGYSDVLRDVAGPEAVLRRVEWAQGAANKLNVGTPPATLAQLAIGPIMSTATQKAIAAAPPQQALALLLASPEFQRR